MRIIVSGTPYGFGADRWRGVTRLSSESKESLKKGSALVICERPFDDYWGGWYVVQPKPCGCYDHRLPTNEEQKFIQEWEARNE